MAIPRTSVPRFQLRILLQRPYAFGRFRSEAIFPWKHRGCLSLAARRKKSGDKSPHAKGGWLLQWCVFLLLAAGFAQIWLLDGLAVPCRIVGGSMAETLFGVHRDVVCNDCGCRFVCGTDAPPPATRAACPNCGYAANDLQSLPDVNADRIVMDRVTFSIRSPRRWEVVAFRQPQQADNILIKRVVGLPGESIEIRNGDVYADRHIQRKTLAQQRALAVLVHDADFEPTRGPTPPTRWQAEGSDSRWRMNGGRFTHIMGPTGQVPSATSSGNGWPVGPNPEGPVHLRIGAETSVAFRSAKERSFRGAKGNFPTVIDSPILTQGVALGQVKGAPSGQIDWLVYRHWQRSAEPGRVRALPITDISSYNPWQTRREEDVYPVTDLILSFRLGPISGHGTFFVHASDGRNDFETRLQFDADPPRYQVFCNGQPIADSVRQAFQPDSEEVRLESLTYRLVEVSLVDQQFLLAIDGMAIVTWPYDRPESSSSPASCPLAIGTQGLDVAVSDVRVYRDVYYTHPIGLRSHSHNGRTVRLKDDEYYVLGDNSPASDDSRTWPEHGAVDGKLLIGKPLVAIPSVSLSLGGRWHFQVPNPVEIRYIR
jgi:hypothetical protein